MNSLQVLPLRPAGFCNGLFYSSIMVEYTTQYLTPEIKLSSFEGKEFRTEVMFEHHILVWLMCGETRIVMADREHLFSGESIFLIPRNMLAAIINRSTGGRSHKAVAMHLTTERLQRYYEKRMPAVTGLLLPQVHVFTGHPLLESCMASLLPWFKLQEALPPDIAALKIEEAITVLRATDPATDGLLSYFEKPGKINLAEFMEKHFMFNLPLEQFGYLCGRSLSAFNRDFRKVFNTTPQKWLTQKRLQLAHYQLSEQKRKPVDVYFEVGFENLSHFSFAFKKKFGYAPSAL